METSQLTRKQIERLLAQRIQALYRTCLEHQPAKVTCQIFDEKLAIVIEGSVTPAEQVLVNNGNAELASKVRFDLYKAFQPHMKALIEEVMGVSVVELLSDATLETGRLGAIAVLEQVPQFRHCDSITKVNKAPLSP
jgi:uncharacterized protein YbcI